MKDIIILITTRDYPIEERSDWQSVNMSNVNDFVHRTVDLHNTVMIEPMQSYLSSEELINDEKTADIIRRILVWEDKGATYCQNSDYFNEVKNNGFALKKKIITGEEEKEYHIYVAPCVGRGDHLDLDFRKSYSLSVLLDVYMDFKNVKESEVILVAHDKDVSPIAGCGVVNGSIFYQNSAIENKPQKLTVCKFQHEAATDTIYKLIVEHMKNNDISSDHCDSLLNYITEAKSSALYDVFSNDLVTNSYLKRIDKEKMFLEHPELRKNLPQ